MIYRGISVFQNSIKKKTYYKDLTFIMENIIIIILVGIISQRFGIATP